MSSEIAIRVQSLSKCYQIYDTPRDRLKQFVLPRLRRMMGKSPKQYFGEFWALKDISFEIKKGETVGIIGRNGSGKSTLLQMICGMLNPTSGAVQTNGRVAALLELGSGFNPEFTGRENVYMNAALLGLGQKEIDARFDDIAAFADIGNFIEQPVKTYSSGMLVRLAFAVNIISEPDIMIVDEALAVGDMNFQAKCMTALTRIQESGSTILFVSHDVGAVKSLCSRGLYLEHGILKAIGKASDVAEQYIRTMREEMNAEIRQFSRVSSEFKTEQKKIEEENVQTLEKDSTILKRSDEFDKRVAAFRYGSGGARITYVELLNMSNEPIWLLDFNQEVKIRIYVESSSEQSISVNFNICDDKKGNLTGCGFAQVEQEFLTTEIGGQYLVDYTLRLPLQEGSYSLRTQITAPIVRGETAEFVDVIENAVVFQMERWKRGRIWSKIHLFPTLNLKRLTENVN
ncbi:Lipopolysaccharide transport system ATP-binding protein [Candidatus Nitrotoga sp. BS]|uniref:ABC transporter ATP-binding protein n=1 Tax=Candidatus Nitrotoga sp. BS TaxID=2890408 RepID=UPI001EF33A91|nr:ABC transporter ATP-binding protein [Candidatus Nitrotoga sp. BS]CAH1192946.1 Lipopolysaccharide transport system ATP-binding protein [Candidatus Nitrotoga sp. BS]